MVYGKRKKSLPIDQLTGENKYRYVPAGYEGEGSEGGTQELSCQCVLGLRYEDGKKEKEYSQPWVE